MAIKIIDQTKYSRQIGGVSVDKSCWWHDQYTGTAEALIAAGIITADQLPGQPGRPKVAATYYAGALRPPKGFTPKDERYLNITRPKNSKRIKVIVGLSKEECARREDKRNAEHFAAMRAKVADVDQHKEYRLMGKRLAWTLWGLASTEGRRNAQNPFNLELSEDGAKALGEAVNKIWSVFDQDALREVTPMRSAAIAAASDKKFQDFLEAQCIPHSHQATE